MSAGQKDLLWGIALTVAFVVLGCLVSIAEGVVR